MITGRKSFVSVPGIYTGYLLLISEGIEPSTFSVLTKCDNRYTMKPCETHGRCCADCRKTDQYILRFIIPYPCQQTIRNRSQNREELLGQNIKTDRIPREQTNMNTPKQTHQIQNSESVSKLLHRALLLWSCRKIQPCNVVAFS